MELVEHVAGPVQGIDDAEENLYPGLGPKTQS